MKLISMPVLHSAQIHAPVQQKAMAAATVPASSVSLVHFSMVSASALPSHVKPGIRMT
jgi:hypothetical protein